jgi:hypothetical protein
MGGGTSPFTNPMDRRSSAAGRDRSRPSLSRGGQAPSKRLRYGSAVPGALSPTRRCLITTDPICHAAETRTRHALPAVRAECRGHSTRCQMPLVAGLWSSSDVRMGCGCRCVVERSLFTTAAHGPHPKYRARRRPGSGQDESPIRAPSACDVANAVGERADFGCAALWFHPRGHHWACGAALVPETSFG